jgi:hypothetical protein
MLINVPAWPIGAPADSMPSAAERRGGLSMTQAIAERTTTDFCCHLARARGLDPIGNAFPFDYRLLV